MFKEVMSEIEVGISLVSGMGCSCDKEVGHVCEICTLKNALEGAKSLLTRRAADGAHVCPHCGQSEEVVVCWKCGNSKPPRR